MTDEQLRVEFEAAKAAAEAGVRDVVAPPLTTYSEHFRVWAADEYERHAQGRTDEPREVASARKVASDP